VSRASEPGENGGASKPKAPARSGVARTLTRIAAYYVVLLAAAGALLWMYPWLTQAILEAGGETVFNDEITRTFAGTPLAEAPGAQGWAGLAVQALSLFGALAIMVPVAWSYIIIKRSGGYDQSVVHTLIILPVAVTGIVIIVKTSVALAFSLAGIVAAVRFRTTLEDTKDAVYVFLAIGVGLAAGSQRLGTAFLASMVFNAVNLFLWKMRFGNIYVDQLHRTSAMGLGDVLAGPGSAQSAISIGDQALLTAMPQSDLGEMVGRVARLERYLDEETDVQTEKKLYAVLLVYTKSVSEAQDSVEVPINAMTLRWRLAEIIPGQEGVSVLQYLVRLKPGVKAGTLLDTIRKDGGEAVQAAELRSLRSRTKRRKPA
jgi:hypothetical protein